jgi:ApbE superfamily uncharacterized protein (UPF0280 family)
MEEWYFLPEVVAIYEERFYRYWHRKVQSGTSEKSSLNSYEVHYRQTNLWVRSQGIFQKEILATVIKSHNEILAYAGREPRFLSALTPLPFDDTAPPIVKTMLRAASEAGVGPMAAVAGAIAERVGKMLMNMSPSDVIVENGGDCFIYSTENVVVGVYGGKKARLAKPIMVKLRRDQLPISVCTSSSFIGHSLSFGKAHAATVFSKDGAFADAVATAIANSLKNPSDIEPVLNRWGSHPKITAIVAIVEQFIGFYGDIELTDGSNH